MSKNFLRVVCIALSYTISVTATPAFAGPDATRSALPRVPCKPEGKAFTFRGNSSDEVSGWLAVDFGSRVLSFKTSTAKGVPTLDLISRLDFVPERAGWGRLELALRDRRGTIVAVKNLRQSCWESFVHFAAESGEVLSVSLKG
jgi:hypothetical protein